MPEVSVAVSVGCVAETEITSKVTESVAEFKTLAMDESIPGSVVVGAELARAVVKAALTSLTMGDRMF
jgi:hypothetical protein